jgi:pimeloyl-ACP methyl ester carboxylesterase
MTQRTAEDPKGSEDAEGSYASVNGLEMYYEIHGAGKPLVLLHGAMSAIGTSLGKVLPSLAKTRGAAGDHAYDPGGPPRLAGPDDLSFLDKD